MSRSGYMIMSGILLSDEFTYHVDGEDIDELTITAEGNFTIHSTNRYTIIIKDSHIKQINFQGDANGVSIILDNSSIDLLDMITYNDYKLTLNNKSFIGLILTNGEVAIMKFATRSCKIQHMICFSRKSEYYHTMNAIQNFVSVYSFTEMGKSITYRMKNAKYNLIYGDKIVFLKSGKYFRTNKGIHNTHKLLDLDDDLRKEILTTLTISNI